MKSAIYFATDYPEPEYGCEYTEWSGKPGIEYPTKQECGLSHYITNPFIYIPAILFLIVILALFVKILNKKSKNK